MLQIFSCQTHHNFISFRIQANISSHYSWTIYEILGSGWQQRWCDGDWQCSPWRWGCVTGEGRSVSGITWLRAFVSQRWDSPLACGNLHTASWVESFWQIDCLAWRSLSEFTVLRRYSGSACMVSLGLISTDSLRTLSHVWGGETYQNVRFMNILDKYASFLTKIGSLLRMSTRTHCICKTRNTVKMHSLLRTHGKQEKKTL